MLSWFPQSPVTSDAPPDGAKSSDAPNETSLPGEQSRTLNEQARTEDALPHDRILGNLLQGQDGSEKGNGIHLRFSNPICLSG
jgi:hypothetical protein